MNIITATDNDGINKEPARRLMDRRLDKVNDWEIIEKDSGINKISKGSSILVEDNPITMVSIKIFITVSMMIGNIIDIYPSGIMIVLINWLMYSGYFGLILPSYLLYMFLTRMELFLIISFIWLVKNRLMPHYNHYLSFIN